MVMVPAETVVVGAVQACVAVLAFEQAAEPIHYLRLMPVVLAPP